MKPIQVTEPFLPPLEEYVGHLKGIWDRNWLTNQGPLVCQLEQELQKYHRIPHAVHCVANGALGLQIALKALGVGGEVITTPFSYIATTACPLWEGCTVKFADIDPATLNISPEAVEAAITPQTEAILATHVFGNPCDVEALESIADRYGLALVYDAAHAFGVRCNGKSILEFGDASMVSLHATKLFHTIEGGFVVAKDAAVSGKIEWMRRFGHKGQDDFYGVGINAKLSEFHAAMGLCNMNYIEEILSSRRRAYDLYLQGLAGLSRLGFQKKIAGHNSSYFPLIFETEALLLTVLKALQRGGVEPRRYFYPALSSVKNLGANGRMKVSEETAKRILCLPLSHGIKHHEINSITTIVKKHLE